MIFRSFERKSWGWEILYSRFTMSEFRFMCRRFLKMIEGWGERYKRVGHYRDMTCKEYADSTSQSPATQANSSLGRSVPRRRPLHSSSDEHSTPSILSTKTQPY